MGSLGVSSPTNPTSPAPRSLEDNPNYPFPRPVTVPEIIDPLRRWFEDMDQNHDGSVTAREYMRWLERSYRTLVEACIAEGLSESFCRQNYEFIQEQIRLIRKHTNWFHDPDLFPKYRKHIDEIEDGLRDLDTDGER